MNNKTSKQLALGILIAAFASSLVQAETAYVAGPVEKFAAESSQVTVLGQTYIIDARTVIVGANKKTLRFMPGQGIEIGSLVSVEAESTASVARATSIVLAKFPYVPGATAVFVAGRVQQVSNYLARLRVGDLEVDVSGLSPALLSSIQIGSFVEILGTQPLPKGLLIGQELSLSDVGSGASAGIVSSESIAGTGVQSIAGTGKQSIAGTGVQSIAGTGAQSIAGTGKQSIAGTGVQSIAGTGVQSIAGTGKQSIAGTGVQSIAGTGVQSIAGTGKQSIAGTGVQSIAGTGVQSIAGTGKQSIAGTGVQSIAGTGVQSIAGTGKQSIAGTGAQSIAGTGVLSIAGTGSY